MSAAHTPGPWGIQDDHGTRWIETTVSNDDTICEVVRRDRKVARDRDVEFNANARLIAAAPELLAVAQLLVQANCPEAVAFATQRAHAAIAKATGQEGGAK